MFEAHDDRALETAAWSDQGLQLKRGRLGCTVCTGLSELITAEIQLWSLNSCENKQQPKDPSTVT